jgi:predicted short-subunit dehydrogenase-like oxidoreductase (DUF2520 family)
VGVRSSIAALIRAQRQVNERSISLEALTEIAQHFPELRVAVAMHPTASPELLGWLDEQGDPAVQQVVARRRANPDESLLPPWSIGGLPLNWVRRR